MKNTSLYLHYLLATVLLFSFNSNFGQKSSRNGIYMPVKGELRILVVYMEVDYSDNPNLDKTSAASIID